jgi:hypothetical protein
VPCINSLFLTHFLNSSYSSVFCDEFYLRYPFRNCLCSILITFSCFDLICRGPLQQLHCTRHSSHSFELYTYTSPILFNAFRHFESRGHELSRHDNREVLNYANAKIAHTNTTAMCINMFFISIFLFIYTLYRIYDGIVRGYIHSNVSDTRVRWCYS